MGQYVKPFLSAALDLTVGAYPRIVPICGRHTRDTSEGSLLEHGRSLTSMCRGRCFHWGRDMLQLTDPSPRPLCEVVCRLAGGRIRFQGTTCGHVTSGR